MHTSLTITGSDSSGGAGIKHLQCKNTLVLPTSIVSAQLEAVCCDIRPNRK